MPAPILRIDDGSKRPRTSLLLEEAMVAVPRLRVVTSQSSVDCEVPSGIVSLAQSLMEKREGFSRAYLADLV